MKALLMHPDSDFDPNAEQPRHHEALARDLVLDSLWSCMAAGDPFLYDVARTALLAGPRNDLATIFHRQSALADCLKNPAVVRELYALALEAMEGRKHHYFGYLVRNPSSVLYGSLELLRTLVGVLRQVRVLVDANGESFESLAFTRLFATLRTELDDEYFTTIERHIENLEFRRGVPLGAKLGPGNVGAGYVLHEPAPKRTRWLERILGDGQPRYTVRLDPRDEAGARALADIRARGIAAVAEAVAQATEHIVSFFEMLHVELAFYVGCLNLHDRLTAMEAPTCLPRTAETGGGQLAFDELYDVCLALTMGRRVTGNCVEADGKCLVMITGANQGGKSTFLRSIGLAQLMLQCGMFVGAVYFRGELCTGLFTHYEREEDATMRKGKLDEELERLSGIADALTPGATVLFNESFAATNEREGSEIARQVVHALLEKRIRVLFVTHLYELARGIFAEARGDALFLRAERLPDSTRTFRVVPGEPLDTSHGEDVYYAVFQSDAAGVA